LVDWVSTLFAKSPMIFVISGWTGATFLGFPSIWGTDSALVLSRVTANGNAESVRGVRVGIEEVNKRGGVLGKRFELLKMDNQNTPIGSKVAADQAVRASGFA
jgi:hypothetical protein